MTPGIPMDRPLTARDFLAGSDPDWLPEVARAVTEDGLPHAAGRALRNVTDSARSAVGAEVSRQVDTLLDLDLGEMVLGVWTKQRALAAAAGATQAAPGTAEVVSFAEHTITSTHRPQVDVLVREVRVAAVHVELSVRFTVRALAGTVRDGRLVALTAGACVISASLGVEGRELARRTARAELPLIVRLGEGIPLPGGAGPDAGGPAGDPEIATRRPEEDLPPSDD